MDSELGATLLEAKNIKKSFKLGSDSIDVLKGLNLSLSSGESLSIIGGSGAGKSTFLHTLGTLEPPTEGAVYYGGEDVFTWGNKELSKFRNENLGFVFQFHYLLNEFTAIHNAALPAIVGGVSKDEAFQRASEILFKMGLQDRMDHYPSQLSGGEQQRVAIARALIMRPRLILADEPTGNLDKNNSDNIQEIFLQIVEEFSVGLIAVTHDEKFAKGFSRIKNMKDGLWV